LTERSKLQGEPAKEEGGKHPTKKQKNEEKKKGRGARREGVGGRT